MGNFDDIWIIWMYLNVQHPNIIEISHLWYTSKYNGCIVLPFHALPLGWEYRTGAPHLNPSTFQCWFWYVSLPKLRLQKNSFNFSTPAFSYPKIPSLVSTQFLDSWFKPPVRRHPGTGTGAPAPLDGDQHGVVQRFQRFFVLCAQGVPWAREAPVGSPKCGGKRKWCWTIRPWLWVGERDLFFFFCGGLKMMWMIWTSMAFFPILCKAFGGFERPADLETRPRCLHQEWQDQLQNFWVPDASWKDYFPAPDQVFQFQVRQWIFRHFVTSNYNHQ